MTAVAIVVPAVPPNEKIPSSFPSVYSRVTIAEAPALIFPIKAVSSCVPLPMSNISETLVPAALATSSAE